MAEFSILLVFVLVLVLFAEFVNGATDAPNAIATVVATRALSPFQAVAMAAVLNALGAMSGTAVAATIGKDIVSPDVVNLATIAAAMVAIIFWSGLAWRFGIPTSESHALVAGLTGAALATSGPEALLWEGWYKVLLGLFFSTFLGFGGGLLIMRLVTRFFRHVSASKGSSSFRNLQLLSSAFMAFSHGSNDGQKFIGTFTLALVLGGVLPEFAVPWWVIFVCSGVMAVGTALGGWRIVQTMGMKMVRLKTHQGFAAETAAATTIVVASGLGIPLSTTHTISTAIVGVGAASRSSAVRWGVVSDIVYAWLLT
ncbi:MAG TPA: inorganic phosphate transporter, partial [Fimbriimonas sp.]